MSGEPVRLKGIPELLRKLDNPIWAIRPMQALLDRWRFDVERGTKANFKRGPGGWIYKGSDRQSVTSERTPDVGMPKRARVGSNSDSFRWGEYGTGLLSEDPQSNKARHWPPAIALDAWAEDHGFASGAEVARIIGVRGGLAPRRYLRDAAKAAETRLPHYALLAAREIEMAAGK